MLKWINIDKSFVEEGEGIYKKTKNKNRKKERLGKKEIHKKRDNLLSIQNTVRCFLYFKHLSKEFMEQIIPHLKALI